MGARRMSRVDVFRMIKRRIKTIGLGEANCHTFKLYDRTADEVTVEDIEKIGI